MRFRWFGALIAALFAFSPLSCAADAFVPGEELGYRMIRQLYLANGEALLSPISLYNTLSMAAEGAKGETRAELMRLLGTQAPAPALSDALKMASAAFVPSETNLLGDYRASLTPYGARLFSLENLSLDEVNAWAREATDGQIEAILSEAPDARVKLLLASAAMLDARWAVPFDPNETCEAPFYGQNGESLARYLSDTRAVDMKRENGFVIARLPYAQADLSAYFLMSDDGDLIKALDAFCQSGATMLQNLRAERVCLSIPRLTLNADNSLLDMAAGLGLTHSCSTDADFSGINGAKDLMLGVLSQRARLTLTEDGVRAAAVTQAQLVEKSALSPETPPELTFDKPFVLLVRDDASGQILFTACVTRPSEKWRAPDDA